MAVIATAGALAATTGVGVVLHKRTMDATTASRPPDGNPSSGTPGVGANPAALVAPPRDREFVYFGPYDDKPGVVHVFDWNGTARGELRLPRIGPGLVLSHTPTPVENSIVDASSDGTRLVLRDGVIIDNRGIVLGRVDPEQGPAQLVWADDGTHLCRTTLEDAHQGSVGPVVLELMTVDGRGRRVARVVPSTTFGYPWVALCSVRDDRVVFVDNGYQGTPGASVSTARVVVVRLSSGEITSSQTVPMQPAGVSVGVSPDGRYYSESVRGGQGGGAVAPTIIRELGTGREVGRLNNGFGHAFSGDGSRLVVVAYPSAGPASLLQVVDWSTGKLIWQTADDAVVVPTVNTEVGTSRLMIHLADGRIVLIDQRGAITVIGRVVPVVDTTVAPGPGPAG